MCLCTEENSVAEEEGDEEPQDAKEASPMMMMGCMATVPARKGQHNLTDNQGAAADDVLRG
jgi:hypothetical protein